MIGLLCFVLAVLALYGAFEVKHIFYTILYFLSFQFLCSTRNPVSSPRPTPLVEADAHRACQGRPSLCPGRTLRRFQAAPVPGRALTGPEHGGHAGCGRDDDQRGSLPSGAIIAPQPCIRQVRSDLTMMQSCASAAKLLGGGPILETGFKTMACFG